jgi:hypothetical protein
MTTPSPANVIFTAANVEVNDVGQVVVTDPEQDPDTGDWAREIRIFGEEEAGTSTRKHLLTIRLHGESRVWIELGAPAQQF